jgi:hypothetical protein
MEVTVLDVRNSPKQPVLSIKAGLASHQGQLELNQPVVLPPFGGKQPSMEVGLFQQLASQALPTPPAAPKPGKDGKDAGSGDPVEAVCSIPVQRSDGSASQVKLKVRRRNDAEAPASGAAPSKEQEEERDQKIEWIQGVFQNMLKEQPEDPARFMLEELRKKRS